MASTPSGTVLCPHCGRPFKRLKSHLPHCKMVGNQMNPPTSGKALSPSLAKLKAIPDQIHLSAKEKKQKDKSETFGQTVARRESKRGKAQIAVDSYYKKPEFIPTSCTPASETGDTSFIYSRNKAASPVTVETNTSTCLEFELQKETADYFSGTRTTLKRGPHLHVAGCVSKKQAQLESSSVACHPEKKPETHALLPIVFEEGIVKKENRIIVSQHQISDHGERVFDVSTNNSMSGKLKLKCLGTTSLKNNEQAGLTGKTNKTFAFVGEEHEKIDMQQIENTKLNLVNENAKLNPVNEEKENEASLGVMKTLLHDWDEDPTCTVNMTGDKSHRQNLEKENNSVVEQDHQHHSDHSFFSSKLLSFQRIDAKDYTASLVKSQSKEITGNYKEQSLSTLSMSARTGDLKWIEQQRNTCVTSSTQAETTCLWPTLGSTNIRADSVGLQWIPQFYISYQQLGVVPGKEDTWEDSIGTTVSTIPKELRAPLLERHLMNVSLGELPSWLANQVSSPRNLQEAVQKAWGRYYSKYINVKKGGIGGIAMLLAGYCVLSYVWNYKQLNNTTAGENITDDGLCNADYSHWTV